MSAVLNFSVFLFLSAVVQANPDDFNSFSRLFQIQVRSERIPVVSVSMPNHFMDLTADLTKDENEVTCGSSDWVAGRTLVINLEEPRRVHAVALLLHRYVEVNLEVYISNSTSTEEVLCNKLTVNTGEKRDVNVICNRELYGERITVRDRRPTSEFFVICEVNVFGAPGTLALPDSGGVHLVAVYIGCGVALLVIIVIVIIIFLCKGRSKSRRPSDAHSLNTLSMLRNQQAPMEGSVVHRRQTVSTRNPVPSPRPQIVSKSIPNDYDRPTSVKDTSTIYETIPGEEPTYLIVVDEKDLYDEASSVMKQSNNFRK